MRDPADVLLSDGLIERDGDRTRTTARWQAAMARAALLERHPDATDEELAALVEAMLPVEEAELAAAWGGASPPR